MMGKGGVLEAGVTKEAFLTVDKVLVWILPSAPPDGQVIAANDGGVQIEWHCGGCDLEIHIQPDGFVKYVSLDYDRKWLKSPGFRADHRDALKTMWDLLWEKLTVGNDG